MKKIPIMNSTTEIDVPAKRIAIQGYPGAFHEIAAKFFFQNEKLEIVANDTFDRLIRETEKGESVDIGIMAIENTLAGSLLGNYHLLEKTSLKVVGEVFLRIRQNLMVYPGTRIEDLREVHSHPIAIAQCKAFFKKHPHIRLVETLDTALSAKKVAEAKSNQVGAIASTLAAKLYNLDMVASGIETNKRNHTRFLILQSNGNV